MDGVPAVGERSGPPGAAVVAVPLRTGGGWRSPRWRGRPVATMVVRLDVLAADSAAPDCLTCGVCCTGRPGTVLVEADDVERWRQLGRSDLVDALVPGHFGLAALPSDASGRCLYQGTAESVAACSIYAVRPAVCAAVPAGGAECLAYRRRGGRE